MNAPESGGRQNISKARSSRSPRALAETMIGLAVTTLDFLSSRARLTLCCCLSLAVCVCTHQDLSIVYQDKELCQHLSLCYGPKNTDCWSWIHKSVHSLLGSEATQKIETSSLKLFFSSSVFAAVNSAFAALNSAFAAVDSAFAFGCYWVTADMPQSTQGNQTFISSPLIAV